MENPQITIRYAKSEDAAILAKLGSKTFGDTFGVDNTPENMAAYLANSFSPEKQAAELAEPGTIFLIAEIEGSPVGFAKLHLGKPSKSVKAKSPVELERIYSLHDWIGRGIGAALMRACLDEAKKRGHDVIWLGVWEHNPRAQVFYGKWGFVKVGTQTFQLGDDLQTDFVMRKKLD